MVPNNEPHPGCVFQLQFFGSPEGTDATGLDGGAGNDRLDGGVGVKAEDFMDGGDGTDTCRNGKVVRNCENII